MRLGEIEFADRGISTAIGSLPFRDATVAAEFALWATPSLPAIPNLPKRSPAEGMISQAVLGISGISLGQYGSIAIDTNAVRKECEVVTDLDSDAYVAFREFLRVASAGQHPRAVKWQFVGPITLGVSLVRAGLDSETAFAIAVRAVRDHTQALLDAVSAALPNTQQVVILDEPSFGVLSDTGSPVGRENGVDMLSSALALIEQRAVAGVHCCGDADWNMILDAGPSLLSLPVTTNLNGYHSRLGRFLDAGGVIGWGVVRTDGPFSQSSRRAWRGLTALWAELLDAGLDPNKLVEQCIVTPACGFGLHSEGSTWRGMEQLREISTRIADGSASLQLSLMS